MTSLGSKEREIINFLHAHVFDRILESPDASNDLKEGVHRTIIRLEERDSVGMIHYYWSSIVGTDRAVTFATRMREEGFSRFEEVIDEFRGRFGPIPNFSSLPEEVESAHRALNEEKEISDKLLQEADDEHVLTAVEMDQLKANSEYLRHRIKQLEEQSRLSNGIASIAQYPSTLENFEDWCTRYLGESVHIHNRAFQGIKRSEFGDVALIYKALHMLREYYVPMKIHGGPERLHAFEQACKELGITEEPTLSGPRSGEEGDTYFVRFSGRRVELDRHLKKGNSRDQRFCLRVYFFWDDEGKQVVVGWLPSHLDTRIT